MNNSLIAWWDWYMSIVIRHYFHSSFLVHFNPTSSLSLLLPISFLMLSFVYASSHSWPDNKDTIQLVMVHRITYSWHWLLDHHMIYLATESPKQSIPDLTTGSCAGAPSAVLSSSHHLKFRTSWTWNVRSSASTVQMPRVIERFLWTTAARLPQPWVSICWSAALDLLRELLPLTGTGKVVVPPTSLTTTLSYGILIRMIGSGKSLGWNTMLTGTHGKGNETRDGQSLDRNWSHILQRWKVFKLEILISFSQESLDTSFNLGSLKSHIVFWIRFLWSRRTWWVRRGFRITPGQCLVELYRKPSKELWSCTQDHLHHPPPNLPLPLPPLLEHNVAPVTTTDHDTNRQSSPTS